jgi:hypothetical protein
MPSLNTKLATAPNVSANYVLKATTSTTIGNSLIFDNGTNVGIGTTTPARQLEIYNATDAFMKFNGARSGNAAITIGTEAAGFVIYDDTNSAYRLVIKQNGNVGIGTSSPVAGILQVNASSNSQIAIVNTSVGTSWLGISSTDMVMAVETGGNLLFKTGCTYPTGISTGTERMRITSTGDVKVQNNGNLALNGGCYILRNSSEVSYGYFIRTLGWKGGGNTDNTPAIAAEGGYGLNFYTNGTVDEKLRLYYDGYIALNSVVFGTTTSGTVRTLYIGNANYLLGGISSIRKSKTNIENVSNVDWIYDLNPVTFNYRKADENKNYTDEFYEDLNYGLIAEDTAPVADFLINYNDKEDGTKEMIGIEYPRLITPLLKAIQDQKKLISELSAKVENQQQTINSLINR